MEPLPTDIPSLITLVRERPEILGQLFQTAPQLAMQVTQQLSQQAPTVETSGGAVVHESVDTQGGYFIGRDFMQVVIRSLPKGVNEEDAQNNISLYLHALITDLAGLKLGEISGAQDKSRQTPLQLADIYIPPNTTTKYIQAAPEQPLQRNSDTLETHYWTALEALSQHQKLTLLGKPGSGKSTFGASVLLSLAQAWQDHPEQLDQLGPGWTYGALLPIRVTLRRFAEQLPPGNATVQTGELWKFITRDLLTGDYGLSEDATRYLRAIASRHGALFLFDGLDECGSPERRARVRAAVDSLMRNAGPKCRFILTSRPYAWPTGADPFNGVYELADMDNEQIATFIHRWYDALVQRQWQTPGDAERRAADLLSARQRPDLRQLAVNPLLLTLMATLHTNRGRLPDDRTDLYNESVELLLLLRWNQQIGADRALLDELGAKHLKLSDVRETLEELAFRVHEENTGHAGTADIGEYRLIEALRPLLDGSRDKAAIVVEYVEKRAGLLIGQGPRADRHGERQFSFPHRTFQEFVAACHLAASDQFPSECVRLASAAPDHWQEVLPLAARVARAERGASAADELINGCDIEEIRAQRPLLPADWRRALLAGQQLLEIGTGALRKSARTQRILSRVCGWLVAMLDIVPAQGGLPAPLRAQAGDVLSALGDPRFNADLFYLPRGADIGFATIPGLPKIRFSRYLTTVAQFRAYLTATGQKATIPEMLRDLDQRPVRWVRHAESIKYCTWLSNSGILPKNWLADLPTESEWEYASRGGMKKISTYWWGDDFDPEQANCSNDITNIKDTSSAGCFPANPYGLYDMFGNIFEWTQSTCRRGLSDYQIACGGAWGYPVASANCIRPEAFPQNFYDLNVGFRVILRSIA